MKEIPLTKDQVAICDDEDFPSLSKYKWQAHRHGCAWYAERSTSRIQGKRKAIQMHNQIMKASGVDHRNGNGLDNRKVNLRVATQQENMRNQKRRIDNTTGWKGVKHDRSGKFQARIVISTGERLHLGMFDTTEEAALAYNQAALKHFGQFARLNQIEREG